MGYVKSVALDETQTVFKKPKKISDLWKIYREQDLEMRVHLQDLRRETKQGYNSKPSEYISKVY